MFVVWDDLKVQTAERSRGGRGQSGSVVGQGGI